ncbi:MAG: hypothetical protein C0619_09975 [Desulfuromonas sp.]|jgi:hypothetical protein|nr:MAG: hypothetical protein C0619_09975 [Desulfuromonas sp.]
MNECKYLKFCAFFKEAKDHEDMDVLNEYVKVFCRGPLQKKCYRLDFMKKHGGPPKSSISPSGLDYLEYLKIPS